MTTEERRRDQAEAILDFVEEITRQNAAIIQAAAERSERVTDRYTRDVQDLKDVVQTLNHALSSLTKELERETRDRDAAFQREQQARVDLRDHVDRATEALSARVVVIETVQKEAGTPEAHARAYAIRQVARARAIKAVLGAIGAFLIGLLGFVLGGGGG